jgi:uncharacterized protein YodC (DUF2158 family)
MTDGQFRIGDIVRLKSGGPDMTVEEIETNCTRPVRCVWFNSCHDRETANFIADTLKRISRHK